MNETVNPDLISREPRPVMARFDYPEQFVTLPEYSEHRGQVIQVLRKATSDEADGPEEGCEQMYVIKAHDGWTGLAWESELVFAKKEGASCV